MDFNLETKEGRIEYLNFCFNVVGAGFGEEIDKSIRNNKFVNEFIDGKLSLNEFCVKFRNEALNG